MLNFFAGLILKTLRQSELRALTTHPNATISGPPKIGNYNRFTAYPGARKIRLGRQISIRNSCSILVGDGAELVLGDSVFMNNYCSINCLEKIEIGAGTLLGEGVRIYDHNHRYGSGGVEHRAFSYGAVKIGKNCWLGSNATILKGVTVGDNCIIGAGSTVYKDIPANTVVMNKQELILVQDNLRDIISL